MEPVSYVGHNQQVMVVNTPDWSLGLVVHLCIITGSGIAWAGITRLRARVCGSIQWSSQLHASLDPSSPDCGPGAVSCVPHPGWCLRALTPGFSPGYQPGVSAQRQIPGLIVLMGDKFQYSRDPVESELMLMAASHLALRWLLQRVEDLSLCSVKT